MTEGDIMQEYIQPVSAIVVSVVIPLIVNVIKTKDTTSNSARWTALIVSVIGGIIVALASGMPTDPSEWATSIFVVIGGVQLVYNIFKSAGITNSLMDSLLDLDIPAKIEGRASVTSGMPEDDGKE